MSEQSDPSQPTTVVDEDLQPQSRILVALDASRESLAALQVAAELAALLEVELHGLYVEDIALIRLAGLPVAFEIGSYSATQRRLDSGAIERDFRIQAQRMRRAVAQTAITARVDWSFRVTRGSVTQELLAAAETAEMLTLGRVGRTPGRRIGSTARLVLQRAMRPVFLLSERGLAFPLLVLHTGSPAANRAVDMAATLLQGRDDTLQLVVLINSDHDIAERDARAQDLADALNKRGIKTNILLPARSLHVDAILEKSGAETVILPAELAPFLESLSGSAILVP